MYTVCPEGGHIPQSCLASGIITVQQTYFPTLTPIQKSDKARSALLLNPKSAGRSVKGVIKKTRPPETFKGSRSKM